MPSAIVIWKRGSSEATPLLVIDDYIKYQYEKGFNQTKEFTLVLPAKLEYIGNMAFMTDDYIGQQNLESIKIPASVNFIGINPFCKETIVYVKKNSPAEKWCNDPVNKKFFYRWTYY